MSTPKIDIKTVSSLLLKQRKYLDVFPEYYELEKVTENGLWHNNQNVLDHVISVFEGLETILKFETVTANQAKYVKRYLSEAVGNISRKDVLVVATLLHDIAKTDTLVKNDNNGTASCPGHELIAASRVKNFSERFGLDDKSEAYVERIVRHHGLISAFLDLIISNKNEEKYLALFRETVGDVDIELVLFMKADLLGSDLEKSDEVAYRERMDILTWMFDQLTTSLD